MVKKERGAGKRRQLSSVHPADSGKDISPQLSPFFGNRGKGTGVELVSFASRSIFSSPKTKCWGSVF